MLYQNVKKRKTDEPAPGPGILKKKRKAKLKFQSKSSKKNVKFVEFEKAAKSQLRTTVGSLNPSSSETKSMQSSEDVEISVSKKMKLMNLKKKERKLLRKKNAKEQSFELSRKLKLLWEELRRDECKTDQKMQLLEETARLIKGHVKELVFAHDTVRVIECLIAVGTDAHRAMLFQELKDYIIPLAKSKYGKFFLIKMLRYGSRDQKNCIMKSFHGKITQLISHTEAAAVVEVAFNECASATQRTELVQEFYGPGFRFFKDESCHTLKQLLEKDAEQKMSIISYMKAVIVRLVQKSVIRHSIVHFILHEFMIHADAQSRSEVIESLREVLAEIVHTKDGSRAAMYCLWHGTAKDRKVMLKGLKPFVSKIAKEEFGHMVLLALFDCVDDTKLVEKYIISELAKDIYEISLNLHGRKVLLYLISHRDTCHFHPDIIRILEQGDGNTTSKKDPEVRKNELKMAIAEPVVQLIQQHIEELYANNGFCLLVLAFLKNCKDKRFETFKAIAELCAIPYTQETRNLHIIESAGSNFMLKKLITDDVTKKEDADAQTFSEILITEIPESVMKSWIQCNRGAFLLLSLLETGIPSVVQRIKKEMEGQRTKLAEKGFKGAELLLKKLKE